MGVSEYNSFLEIPLESKGNSIIQGSNEKGTNIRSSLWSQGLKRLVVSRRSSVQTCRTKGPKRILMKRRRRIGASGRRGSNGVVRRVRTLKKLIPNSASVGTLDGLFRETADYILSLQMRVRVMQIMVNVLSAGSDH